MKTAPLISISIIASLLTACADKSIPVAPEEQIVIPPIETPAISYSNLGAGTFAFSRTISSWSAAAYFVDSRVGSISVLPRSLVYAHMSPDGQSFVDRDLIGWIPALYLYNTDGTRRQITPSGKWADNPTWSYDGQRIFFMTLDLGIASVLQVTPSTGVIAQTPMKGAAALCDDIGSVSESASGRLLFLWNRPDGNTCTGDGIFAMNANGSGLVQVLPGKLRDGIVTPVWSPDEKKIAFQRQTDWAADGSYSNAIIVMNPDGTGLKVLAALAGSARIGFGVSSAMCWSADGSRILFINEENGDEAHIYSVRADGTGLTQITFGHVWDSSISCGR
jgi:Tol biopolymer transport system component